MFRMRYPGVTHETLGHGAIAKAGDESAMNAVELVDGGMECDRNLRKRQYKRH